MEPQFRHDHSQRGENDRWTELGLWDSRVRSEERHYCSADLEQFSLSRHESPSREQPRERLLHQGAECLSIGELLSVLLSVGQGSGSRAEDPGQLIFRQLEDEYADPLEGLRTITPQELISIPGIGPARVAVMLAAVELGRRLFCSGPVSRRTIEDPGVAARVLAKDLMWQSQEKFAVILLDVKHRLLGTQTITVGTATETLAHPRDIFRAVIRKGATRVIVAHNHPSGATDPSVEDLALTRQLLQAGQLLGIPVLDHLILGNGSYSSLRQTTLLWDEISQEVTQASHFHASSTGMIAEE